MTNVGWVGLGRLGAPCAAALARVGGHTVHGYDVRGVDVTRYDWDDQPAVNVVASVDEVVAKTDNVVFVAVQTPHSHRFGGEVVAPDETREFEYAFLVQAVRDVCRAADALAKRVTLVVVSTVLPGTFDRELRPLLGRWITPVYHPFFIAMGTVVHDFLNPEQTLYGVDDPEHVVPVDDLYAAIHDAPTSIVSIPSAELAKVAYNTFISMKIVFANSLAQLSEHTGADVDEVTDVLGKATQRIISPRYLRAGMGDGGACHPRDNVALSTLARRFDVVDLMGFVTRAREEQCRALAERLEYWADLTYLPIVLLGSAYKPNVRLVDGSPTLLLSSLLERRHRIIDPVVNASDAATLVTALETPAVFCVCTPHDALLDLDYPTGSVVVDPHGVVVGVRPGVTLVRPGRR